VATVQGSPFAMKGEKMNLTITFECVDKDNNREIEYFHVVYRDGSDLDNQLMKIGDRLLKYYIDYWEISRNQDFTLPRGLS